MEGKRLSDDTVLKTDPRYRKLEHLIQVSVFTEGEYTVTQSINQFHFHSERWSESDPGWRGPGCDRGWGEAPTPPSFKNVKLFFASGAHQVTYTDPWSRALITDESVTNKWVKSCAWMKGGQSSCCGLFIGFSLLLLQEVQAHLRQEDCNEDARKRSKEPKGGEVPSGGLQQQRPDSEGGFDSLVIIEHLRRRKKDKNIDTKTKTR